jgi:two-component system CheB/CheR fusion protein
MHGGTVEAQSEGAGRGSEFTVRLPAVPAGDEPPERRERPPPVAPLPRRFLVVDDNVDSAESLAELLSLNGHEVRTSHDGADALRAAQAQRPDVILLDIGLPQLDGYEVARRLRRLPDFQAVTLIAMTGYGQEEDRSRARDAGFDHHLVKPVGFEDIAGLLSSPSTGPSSRVRE